MNRQQFEDWLTNYGKAWEEGDSDSVIKLFSEDVEYYETPFDIPLKGYREVYTYWKEGADETQEDVRFEYEIICINDNSGYAEWQASFRRVPLGSNVKINGILSCEFDDRNKCRIFREWWHREETS